MADNDSGRQLLKGLADKVRAKSAVTTDPQLHQRGLNAIEALARDLTSPDGMPGIKLLRDTSERFRLQRDRRAAEVIVEWRREIGAIAMSAERNGTRSRAIHYVPDEVSGGWRRLEATGELYEDLVAVLTEYLYPEAR